MAGPHLLNKTCLTAIWEHLSISNGTITTTNPWLQRMQREHDTSMMAIVSSSNFTNKQKQHINAFRIYLQTISISEISTFDRNSITQHVLDRKIEDITSSLRWPNQQRPHKSWWNTWRYFLLILANGNLFLFQPLGDWTLHKQCIQPRKWYLEPNPNTLLEWTGTQWLKHNKQGRSLNKFSKERIRMTEDPILCARVSVIVQHSSLERKDYVTITMSIPREIRDSCPWKQEYLPLPTHLNRIVGPCPRPPQVFQTMPETIALPTASDGSVENEKGYHGWIVATLDNATIIEVQGLTNGRIQDTTSYRTEVSGTIAILTIYNMIVKLYNWKAKEIEHVCDSESAFDILSNVEPDGVSDQSRPDADVIIVAKVQLQKSKHTKIVPLTPTKNRSICDLKNLRDLHIKHYHTNSRLVMTAYTSQNNIFRSAYRAKK
jgi:hypothetical protein